MAWGGEIDILSVADARSVSPARDITYLREAFALVDGKLHWRCRPESHFANARIARSWNTQHAGNAVSIRQHHYPRVLINKSKYVYVHRLFWALTYGELPDEIDHINGDVRDYRIENLRAVTHARNQKNLRRRSDNSSGVTGVYRKHRRWVAEIKSDGRRFRLGSFKTLEEAARARRAAQRKLGFSDRHGSDQCQTS